MFFAAKVSVFVAFCLALSMASSRDGPLAGGITNLSGIDLNDAEAELQTSLTKLAAGEGPNYKISKVHSASRQIVSGTMTRLNVALIDDKNAIKNCKVSIWSQPWLPNGIEVSFDCVGQEKVVKNHDA